MKKTLIFIITIAITFCIAFAMGRNEIIPTKDPVGVTYINYKEAYYAEKKVASAALELLHLWYSNENNEYWYNVVVLTEEYQKLDNALNQDWEDFYLYETPIMWESITYKPNYDYANSNKNDDSHILL